MPTVISSLKPPDTKGDAIACTSAQVLKHYQDPCQSLAESEANQCNAEKKIQLELSGIEGELLDPRDVLLKGMECGARTAVVSGSTGDAQN